MGALTDSAISLPEFQQEKRAAGRTATLDYEKHAPHK
jgi:hypothetical protein